MVMKTLEDAENEAVLHPTLKLPLSPQGTVRTAGEKEEQRKVLIFFKGARDGGTVEGRGQDHLHAHWSSQGVPRPQSVLPKDPRGG